MGQYPNCASNRKEKFERAVYSFMSQEGVSRELIVVADGCPVTEQLFAKSIAEMPENLWGPINFKFAPLQKQTIFSGAVRNEGLKHVTGDIVCYLDTDDGFLPDHLKKIEEGFNKAPNADWVYFDDFVCTAPIKGFRISNRTVAEKTQRNNILEPGRIGTSSIAHKKDIGIEWPDGYGHDWEFVSRLKNKFENHVKINPAGYLVCHVPGGYDF